MDPRARDVVCAKVYGTRRDSIRADRQRPITALAMEAQN
jgi:hypothetical protein